MGSLTGIFFGLTAALGWGMTDFLGKRSTERISFYRALLYVDSVCVLSAIPLIVLDSEGLQWRFQSLFIIVIVGALYTVAALGLFHAFQVGQLAIVSPVSGGFAIVTALLGIVMLHESLTLSSALGVVLTLLGVAGASTRLSELKRMLAGGGWRAALFVPGIPSSLIAAVGYGTGLFLLDFVVGDLGAVVPHILTRGLEVLFVALIAGTRSLNVSPPPRETWWVFVGVALFDTLASVSYNVGIQSEYVSIVSVLSSSGSAIAVVLAGLVLRERLEINQYVGIAAIIAGILLVSVR